VLRVMCVSIRENEAICIVLVCRHGGCRIRAAAAPQPLCGTSRGTRLGEAMRPQGQGRGDRRAATAVPTKW
jgi:hypothetical protein